MKGRHTPLSPERAVEALHRMRGELVKLAMGGNEGLILSEITKIHDAWVGGDPWSERFEARAEKVAAEQRQWIEQLQNDSAEDGDPDWVERAAVALREGRESKAWQECLQRIAQRAEYRLMRSRT